MQKQRSIRLFFLPYAGANKYAYKVFEREFPPEIIVCPLELPGRGNRFTEPLITNLDTAVEDIFLQMKPYLSSPYAVFGHSMGAVLGYLVTMKIIEHGLPGPRHLICSGRSGLWNEHPQSWYLMDGPKFWNTIYDLGGLPGPSLVNEEMKNLFEPILRADFQMVQFNEVNRLNRHEKLDVPLTVFLGRADKITHTACTWYKYVSAKPSIIYFDGGHFFFLENCRLVAEAVMRLISFA